jgi:hypothetical protein
MSKKRTSFLSEIQRDQRDRLRAGRGAHGQPPTADDLLLARAERRVRRTLWLRKTLPLNLLFLVPGLFFIGTSSRVVLALFVVTYPLLFLVRALLARLLSAWIGPEEILIRREYERLRMQREDATGD